MRVQCVQDSPGDPWTVTAIPAAPLRTAFLLEHPHEFNRSEMSRRAKVNLTSQPMGRKEFGQFQLKVRDGPATSSAHQRPTFKVLIVGSDFFSQNLAAGQEREMRLSQVELSVMESPHPPLQAGPQPRRQRQPQRG
ncbi:unnamed protein product [Tetraodon nigroviridis]|uniref:(spotted green pufferfish) hypothetical protein n=1 Tax=Tetraodon nigroviridis TaxID=99883 RepID=Q4SMM0_TETNG|nr:unnamed protein product [Tetraodon nigroviridis]